MVKKLLDPSEYEKQVHMDALTFMNDLNNMQVAIHQIKRSARFDVDDVQTLSAEEVHNRVSNDTLNNYLHILQRKLEYALNHKKELEKEFVLYLEAKRREG